MTSPFPFPAALTFAAQLCMMGFNSILMPFMDEHLGINTEWDLYRCDMNAEMAGKIRLITPVKETVPLIFDKDCRKVLRKLKKVKSKLQ